MELTTGRMFDAYGASMDAALQAKCDDIMPWLVPGLIVDRGCGTGSFMKYLAAQEKKVVGIELSDTLAKHEPGVIQANVCDPVFASGFVSNIILSSVMHEVYSYGGYSLFPVVSCLSNCVRELRSGGRIIIRDIWSPEPVPFNADRPEVDLTLTDDLMDKLKDLIRKSPEDLEKECVLRSIHPATRACMSMRLAVEFLSKKDYDKHWDLECREVYTSVPLSAYRKMAETLKLKVIAAKPRCNEWILENRWKKGVTGDIPHYTNQLVVLEKP